MKFVGVSHTPCDHCVIFQRCDRLGLTLSFCRVLSIHSSLQILSWNLRLKHSRNFWIFILGSAKYFVEHTGSKVLSIYSSIQISSWNSPLIYSRTAPIFFFDSPKYLVGETGHEVLLIHSSVHILSWNLPLIYSRTVWICFWQPKISGRIVWT